MQFHKDYPKMPLVYNREVIEDFTKKKPLKTTSVNRIYYECEYCGKKKLERRLKRHINICQTKSVHIFCSKDCKNIWCFDISQKRLEDD